MKRAICLAVLAAGAVLAGAGCGSHRAVPAARSASATPFAVRASAATPVTPSESTGAAPASDAPAPPARPASPSAVPAKPPAGATTGPGPGAHTITASITDFPSAVTTGSVVEFAAVLSNQTNVDYHSVAPLFQLVGGDCNCVNGGLERFDATRNSWQVAPMPEGDGYDPLSVATGGVDLLPGMTVTVRYRLTVSPNNMAKPATAVLYIVSMPDMHQVGSAAKVGTRVVTP